MKSQELIDRFEQRVIQGRPKRSPTLTTPLERRLGLEDPPELCLTDEEMSNLKNLSQDLIRRGL